MFDKWKTIRLLKSKRQSVLIYFDSDYVYLIKTGMFKNICYRLIVPELLKDVLTTYVLDGSYIIYKGQVSPSTGQVVSTVTTEAPVETATGVSIVSTKAGKVILSDGSEVAPETIGAKTNEDKTITVTKKDGSKVTLPHTGEAKTLGLSLLGALMALTGALVWKQKKVQNN